MCSVATVLLCAPNMQTLIIECLGLESIVFDMHINDTFSEQFINWAVFRSSLLNVTTTAEKTRRWFNAVNSCRLVLNFGENNTQVL